MCCRHISYIWKNYHTKTKQLFTMVVLELLLFYSYKFLVKYRFYIFNWKNNLVNVFFWSLNEYTYILIGLIFHTYVIGIKMIVDHSGLYWNLVAIKRAILRANKVQVISYSIPNFGVPLPVIIRGKPHWVWHYETAQAAARGLFSFLLLRAHLCGPHLNTDPASSLPIVAAFASFTPVNI